MSWDTIFSIANGWALLMWIVLIALPRTQLVQTFVFYAGVGLLCFAYVLTMGLVLGDFVDPAPVGEGGGGGTFTSIAGVRALFASDGGIVIGWIHYLAFDLFAGIWIAKDADHKHFSRLVQAPVLLLTFMAGPAGLLLWFLIRERRARASAGPRRVN
ncbi:ABA4-like family protein [Aurantiacibacter sp. D1-12]|uniref:ABA4-like family protein n=1 Tax=Aurantiacibacter sp. D1-12 TaxID=2993658 RepID=UPI00237CB840|nr:ABA4-like family protein [Aurantiacibacter sp. D1-12]MDE1466331.1 ABA4-like family protein [Aurantiacibacter sp. D1-12]